MSVPGIDSVWKRIVALEGQGFHTISGKPFTYSVDGDAFIPSRTDYRLSKGNLAKALAFVPFAGPGVVNQLVRGPAYVWAVLHDPRVREMDW